MRRASQRRGRRRVARVALAIGAAAILLAGCSSARESRSSETLPNTAESAPTPIGTSPSSATPPPTLPPAPTVELADTQVTEPAILDAADPPRQLEAGNWHVKIGPAALNLDVEQPMRLAYVDSGALLLEGPESTAGSFEGLGIFHPTVFLATSTSNVVLGRHQPTIDLESWMASIEGIENRESGTELLGAIETQWWQFDEPGDCGSCARSLYHAGELNGAFFTPDDYRWKLWTFEVDGQPLLITIEARTERFDAFAASVQPILTSLAIGGEARPGTETDLTDDPPEVWGVGRAEIIVSDRSRTTEAFERNGEVILAGQDERVLLTSVGYPVERDQDGWNAPPAAGPFPLILVAHSLGGDGFLAPLDQALVRAGYVVARVRFPESSPPVSGFHAIREQPADMSFAISELLDGALPDQVRAAIDPERIGVVGFSMGGTTVYGLLGASCCLDSRISAAIGHAPASFDFDEGLEFRDVPLLLIGSRNDLVAPLMSLEEIRVSASNSISLYAHQSSAHLDWTVPANQELFGATVELSRAFFAEHLRGSDITLADVATQLDGDFVASDS